MAHDKVIRKAIHDGLLVLRRYQRADGGFDCEASKSPLDFSQSRVHKTPFLTALILSALCDPEDTKLIGEAGVAFLLEHRSSAWSWNYWQRDCKDYTDRAYPDDMDDTICALAAVNIHSPTEFDGTLQAALAKLLIATEEKPAGPYRTWLVDRGADVDWLDVDIA
ncbi:MAG TPA: hypothetical protein VMR98_05605, partial [Candidatus Polarisedimenticolaceae bacterium]|nr:hypothetical protein [Candidatus Polarisedimenticolaceae bacterium]